MAFWIPPIQYFEILQVPLQDVFRHNAGVAPRTFQGSFNFGPEGTSRVVIFLDFCTRASREYFFSGNF